MIRGIIEVPPKLVKPILAKAKKSWNNVLIMLLHPHPDKAQHSTADHQHQDHQIGGILDEIQAS